jgi:hypothetical protein
MVGYYIYIYIYKTTPDSFVSSKENEMGRHWFTRVSLPADSASLFAEIRCSLREFSARKSSSCGLRLHSGSCVQTFVCPHLSVLTCNGAVGFKELCRGSKDSLSRK